VIDGRDKHDFQKKEEACPQNKGRVSTAPLSYSNTAFLRSSKRTEYSTAGITAIYTTLHIFNTRFVSPSTIVTLHSTYKSHILKSPSSFIAGSQASSHYSIHSLTHSLTHSLIHSFVHSFIQSFIRLLHVSPEPPFPFSGVMKLWGLVAPVIG